MDDRLIKAKDLDEVAFFADLSFLMELGVTIDVRTADDALAMDLYLFDGACAAVTVVNDAVDIDKITNDPCSHSIGYQIEGSPYRSKFPYPLAVFQVCIQGPGDPPPSLDSDLGWSGDYISVDEPFVMLHILEDEGKIAYYRARWETEEGVKGPWTMAGTRIL
jgi:hypothetical protein